MRAVEAVAEGGTLAKILGVGGSWGSGLAAIHLVQQMGEQVTLYADNGPLVRALEDAFGDVIQEGHTFNPGAVVGKEIAYWADETGMLMESFLPVEEGDDAEDSAA